MQRELLFLRRRSASSRRQLRESERERKRRGRRQRKKTEAVAMGNVLEHASSVAIEDADVIEEDLKWLGVSGRRCNSDCCRINFQHEY